MSDETPTPEAEPAAETPEAPAAPDAPEGAGGAVATIVDAPVAHPTAPVAPVTFRSKFLMPLLVPLGVTATIVFYILNVSRVFLAVGGSVAVTYAAIITVVILAGGSVRLAASPKVRSSSLTLIMGGSLLVLLMGGLISIGAASPKTASGPVQCKPVKSTLSIVAGANGALRFTPQDLTAKAGCIDIKITFDGTHTLQFDDPAAANAFPLLDANLKNWAGTLPAGTYKFHCTIPGHETAGMVGTLTVS